MATSFADVTGGMNPLQAQQSLNAAQEGTRNEIDWANKQALRNIQSKHTNDDGSLDHFGFIHEAASAGIGPDAVKAWLSNQNDTNAAATNQTNTNFLLKTLNLNPNALRDQTKLPGTPGAGQNNTIDGEPLAPGQSIQYNNEKGAGAPVGPSTLDIDKLPSNSDEVRARAAARVQNGAVPQPTDLDTQTNAMGARASAWGKGSPTTAAIQKQIGLTGSDVDGTWGPKTAAAYKAYLANNPNAGVVQAGSKLQFLQDQTANPNIPTTGDQETGNGAVGSQTNPAPYVKGEPHYSDTYYGVPGQNGIVPIKGSVQRPAGAAAFTPTQPTVTPSASSTSAGAFTPKPLTGARAMTATAGPTDVVVNGRNQEANDGGTFTAPAPEDYSQTITSTPDRRSILERLADSGSGTPTIPGATDSSVKNESIFNYKNVVARGGLNLKSGLDATLTKFGKTTDQNGVDELLDQAALGVTPPTPQTKDGKLDPFATATTVAEYNAKVIAAKTAMAKALADGNTTAVGEILAQSKYRNIEQPEAARAAKLYGEGQLTVQQLAAKGYKGVNPSNAAEYQKVDTDLEVAKGIIDGVHDLTSDIRSNPRMSKDELSTRTNTFLLRMLDSDGAGTEGAGDMILGSLGAPKSIRQQWAEAKIGGVKELPSTVANFLRTALTKNKPTDFANLLDDQAKGLVKYGAAGRAAKAHGLQNPFGEPTGPGAFTPKPSAGSGRASKKGR